MCLFEVEPNIFGANLALAFRTVHYSFVSELAHFKSRSLILECCQSPGFNRYLSKNIGAFYGLDMHCGTDGSRLQMPRQQLLPR